MAASSVRKSIQLGDRLDFSPFLTAAGNIAGLLCDSRMFEAQRAGQPNVLVVDGFYGGANRIEAMAAYALAKLPDRFALLGHSMGARVALEIVRCASERVERLVICPYRVGRLVC